MGLLHRKVKVLGSRYCGGGVFSFRNHPVTIVLNHGADNSIVPSLGGTAKQVLQKGDRQLFSKHTKAQSQHPS